MSEIRFRSASAHDVKALTDLIRDYYAFDHIPFDGHQIAAGLSDLIRNRRLAKAWLIEVGASKIGYVIVTFWFDLEFGGRAAAITDLYLRPEHRRKGFGREIIKFVETFCRKAGISALELQVERRNRAAQAFYKATGFVAHDRIPMSKRIPPAQMQDKRHRSELKRFTGPSIYCQQPSIQKGTPRCLLKNIR